MTYEFEPNGNGDFSPEDLEILDNNPSSSTTVDSNTGSGPDDGDELD